MTHYMARVLTLAAALLICGSHASNFNCNNLDTVACKTKFAKKFGDDIKILHLNAIRKLFTTYINDVNAIRAELPDNDELIPLLEQSATEVSKHLEKLNANTDDKDKISSIVHEAIKDMEFEALKSTNSIKRSVYIRRQQKSAFEIMQQMLLDAAELWNAQYVKLRAEDLEVYPEYGVVNDLMKVIEDPLRSEDSLGAFSNAADILGKDFNIPYFKAILN